MDERKCSTPSGSCWLKCVHHDSHQPDHKWELTELTNKRTERNKTKRNETKQNKTKQQQRKTTMFRRHDCKFSKFSMSDKHHLTYMMSDGCTMESNKNLCVGLWCSLVQSIYLKKQHYIYVKKRKTCTITHRIDVWYIYLYLGDFLW